MNRRSFIGMLAALPLVGRLPRGTNEKRVGLLWLECGNDIYGSAEHLRQYVAHECKLRGAVIGKHLHCTGLGNHRCIFTIWDFDERLKDVKYVNCKLSVDFPNDLAPRYQTTWMDSRTLITADKEGRAAIKLLGPG